MAFSVGIARPSAHATTLAEWQNDLCNFSTGLFGLANFTLIVYLFRNLFSKEVLAYVWKQTPLIEPAMAELQT